MSVFNGSIVAELHEKFPCRENDINLLLSIFGERYQAAPPSIFLYGHTGTGKTAVMQKILTHIQLPHVFVNCVECYNQRLIFEHMLNNLSGVIPSAENNFEVYARCDNTNDFILHLKNILQSQGLTQETVYLVLDKAERLRDMDVKVLPSFLRLQELVDAEICVIFISEIGFEKFLCRTGFMEPFIVHFSDYSQDDLIEILLLDCPLQYTMEFYRSYLNLLLSVFITACRDLKELKHLARLNFPKYVEPLLKGEASATESRKLWRAFEPHLKKALHTVYLREVSSAQWEKLQMSDGDNNLKSLLSRQHLELPYYSKFMLIAAYLASYNPAKSDRRFFTKRDDKMSKRAVLKKKKNEKITNQLLGPKAFPLDRMMAIFYSIIESKVAPTGYFYSQISTLVTIQLLGQIGCDDQLDTPKYKCLVSLDFIRSISRTVNFEIMRYLYDFA